MKAIYARYLVRNLKTSSELGPWDVLPSPAMNTSDGHDKLVSKWNRRDAGRRLWTWQEVQVGDFDHPSQVAGKRK